MNAAMMILAVAGLYLPATFSLALPDAFILEEISLIVAGLLLLVYLAYLAYTVTQTEPAGTGGSLPAVRHARSSEHAAVGAAPGAVPAAHGPAAAMAEDGASAPAALPPGNPTSAVEGTPALSASPSTYPAAVGGRRSAVSGPAATEHHEAEAVAKWSVRKALLVLAGATAGTALVSEMLVGAVEPVTHQLGWSEFFVGVIIIPLVGNAAEHFSAVQMAWRNRMDLSLAIAAGSSTQVALLVAPLLVFISLAMGNPMNLIFVPLELMVLGLATAIFGYISLDGESNWLEGLQLLALYIIAAVVFFFLRVH
jgi:Ca2+/H+ antiporter